MGDYRTKCRLLRRCPVMLLLVASIADSLSAAASAQEPPPTRLPVVYDSRFLSPDGYPQPNDNPVPTNVGESAYSVSEPDLIQRLPPVECPEALGPCFESEVIVVPDGQDEAGQKPPTGGPGQGPDAKPPVSYKVLWFPSVSLEGQQGTWGLVGQDFAFMAPLYMGPPNIVLLTGGVNNRLISTNAVMPDSHQPYPDNLWDVRLGLTYIRQLTEGRSLTCGINIGSASDRPFGSLQEMNVSGMAMYRRPSGERNAWLLGAIYSPTSEIQFPIPLVAYNWNPNDQFQANLGLPFSLSYRPDDRWTFEASYMLIHTINVKASYRLADWLKIVGGYASADDIYSLYDRQSNKDRFFLYNQRVSLGLESSLTKCATIELTGGYAFDRYSYVGRQWDSVQYDRVDIANGPFLMLNGSLRR